MDSHVCLVVDDEPAIRRLIIGALRQKGIRGIEAGNAVEALRILQANGGKIDLLITDVQMPGEMDGLDLAHSVRGSYSGVPVILTSGDFHDAPTGFTIVRKPFLSDSLLRAIDRTLSSVRLSSAGMDG
jgi:DNA-binding NtrC family response regulator